MYLHLWFFPRSLYLSFYLLCFLSFFSLFNQVIWQEVYKFTSPRSLLVFALILREWLYVWLKCCTLQNKELILIKFFFLVSHLLPILLLGVLLFFFIIYFYLIDITYKYNKLLLIWQKYMISYLILFIYAFNGYSPSDL